MTQRSLITGAAGQDGWYLSQLLLHTDEVLATTHRRPLPPGHPMMTAGAQVESLDVTDAQAVSRAIRRFQPDRVFHLAGFSSAGRSWVNPVECLTVNTSGTATILEAIDSGADGNRLPRLVNASSAEIFDCTAPPPYSESSALGPRNPYGVSKSASHQLVQAYRRHGLHCSNAILFNHDSPLRTTDFVTGRIVAGVADIHLGHSSELTLGNLEARRDWTFAGDVALALIAIADAPHADDWVVASGESRSVADFVATAFAAVGMDNWDRYVRVDPTLLRTGDAPEQRGDPRRITDQLGWRATTPFATWVAEMVHRAIDDRSHRRPETPPGTPT